MRSLPEATLRLFRQRRFAVPFLLSTVAAWVVLNHDFTLSSLGLRREVVDRFSALYLGAQVLLLFGSDSFATAARWGWARLSCVVVVLAGGFVYGASSSHEVSPAWVFSLAIVHLALRLDVHRSRVLTTLFVTMGPLLHLALAPRVTWLSFGVAVATGLGAGLVLLLLGRKEVEAASLHADTQLEHRELDARRRLLSRVAVAMAVHDSLSGLLVGVRVKVQRAKAYADVAAAIATLLERSRGVLDGRQAAPGKLLASVRDAVEAHGSTLDLRVEQRRPLQPGEESDVRDIVSEACLNAARSGPGSAVRAHVVIDGAGVSIWCRGTGGSATRLGGQGRGLRNMRLRAWSRGGTFFFDAGGRQSTLTISWPLNPLWRRLGAGTVALMLGVAAVPAVAAGHTLALCCVLVMGVMTAALLRLASRAAADGVPDLEPPGDPLDAVRAALGPSLKRLEEAHAAESLSLAADGLLALSTTFTALLADLERESMPLMPQLTAAPAKATIFAFERQHEALLGWRMVAAAGFSSAVLSLPAAVELLKTPAWTYRAVNGAAVLIAVLVASSVGLWARAPWAAPLRALVVVLLNVIGSSSGAMSADAFGAGWLLYGFMVFLNAHLDVHRLPALLPLLAATPLLSRLVFVSGASGPSLAVAATMGLACVAASVGLARRRAAVARLEAPEPIDEREALARRAVVDGLATAMELHDALGGELLKLRLRLKKAAQWSELEPSIDRVLARGRELLDGEPRALGGLPEAMRAIGASTGREVKVTVEGRAEALGPREAADVWSMVRRFIVDGLELSAGPLTVGVKVLAQRVELVFHGAEATMAEAARPARNAKLRTWARGGTFLRESPNQWRVSWSRRAPWPARSFAGAVSAAGLALSAVWAAVAGAWLLFAVGALVSAAAFLAFVPIDRRRHAVVRRLEALQRSESSGGLGAARARLEPPLAALARARDGAAPREASSAAESLGEALVETVRVLEESSLQALGPLLEVPVGPLR